MGPGASKPSRIRPSPDPFPIPHHSSYQDAAWVAPRLAIGAAPPPNGQILHQLGFTALVLCSQGYQPHDQHWSGLVVVRARLRDTHWPTNQEIQIAIDASDAVAALWRAGHRVLVTCRAGLNRSGLVTGLALQRALGAPGWWCARRVVARRDGALCNETFRKIVEGTV